MKLAHELEKEPVMNWKEWKKTLTLTGEPVLEVSLSWPEWEGKGPLPESAGRCYARLARRWRRHWEREGYIQACLALVERREQSRPFTPWRAQLSGQVSFEDEKYLSFALLAQEIREDGRVLEYRWGDIRHKEDGSAVTLRELFAGERRWRRRLWDGLDQAARESRQRGIYLDEDPKKAMRRWFSPQRAALTPEGLEIFYPQCTIAPAAEGAPGLRLPLPQNFWGTQEEA